MCHGDGGRNFWQVCHHAIDTYLPKSILEWGTGHFGKYALKRGIKYTVVAPDWIEAPLYLEELGAICEIYELDTSEYVKPPGAYDDFDFYIVDHRRRREILAHLYTQTTDALICLHDAQRERYHAALELFPRVHFMNRSFAIMSNTPEIVDSIAGA